MMTLALLDRAAMSLRPATSRSASGAVLRGSGWEVLDQPQKTKERKLRISTTYQQTRSYTQRINGGSIFSAFQQPGDLSKRPPLWPIKKSNPVIEIIGQRSGSEFKAAEKFAYAFEQLLGDKASSSDVRIVVSAKTYGERRQDIDLVIAGKLSRPWSIPQSRTVDRDARLLSFFLTVEVKDHPPNRISFVGPKVFVTYKNGKEDASEQAEQQKYSAKSYIEKHGLDAPYIVSLVLLNNLPSDQLPNCRHNLLGGNFVIQDVLDVIYMAFERRLTPDNVLIQSYAQGRSASYLDVVRIFTAQLQPTQLDRKKIELITKRNFDQKYATRDLGQQLLIFAGPGGTGKTVNLLQLAHFVFRERDAKSLVLTYNLALVSDIRRLMALMGMSDDIATARVQISTVHSFMYNLLSTLKLFERGASGFLRSYEDLKNRLLEVIDAVDREDYEHWDYIFVDEAQDWPVNEMEIIYRLYGIANTTIADGKAQLVRTQSHCDWTKGKTVKSRYVNLSKSLRLKHDLCRFVVNVVEELEIPDWVIEPNVELFGGRVIVFLGDLTQERRFIDDWISATKEAGNHEVDMFFCVPPSMVVSRTDQESEGDGTDIEGPGKFASCTPTIESWGYTVWDGVDEEIRHNYPTKVNQLRIVQYDSCRGLEGWSVINFALDELYDYKKKSFEPSSEQRADMFFDHDHAAEQYARRWVAIPLTRAIDTLVVNIRNPDHWLAEVFSKAAAKNDAVEFVMVDGVLDLPGDFRTS